MKMVMFWYELIRTDLVWLFSTICTRITRKHSYLIRTARTENSAGHKPGQTWANRGKPGQTGAPPVPPSFCMFWRIVQECACCVLICLDSPGFNALPSLCLVWHCFHTVSHCEHANGVVSVCADTRRSKIFKIVRTSVQNC